MRMDAQSPSENTNPPGSEGDRQNHHENSDEDEEVVIRGNVNRANRFLFIFLYYHPSLGMKSNE